jgi:hypothetical protein
VVLAQGRLFLDNTVIAQGLWVEMRVVLAAGPEEQLEEQPNKALVAVYHQCVSQLATEIRLTAKVN